MQDLRLIDQWSAALVATNQVRRVTILSEDQIRQRRFKRRLSKFCDCVAVSNLCEHPRVIELTNSGDLDCRTILQAFFDFTFPVPNNLPSGKLCLWLDPSKQTCGLPVETYAGHGKLLERDGLRLKLAVSKICRQLYGRFRLTSALQVQLRTKRAEGPLKAQALKPVGGIGALRATCLRQQPVTALRLKT